MPNPAKTAPGRPCAPAAPPRTEWPTLGLIALAWALFGLATGPLAALSLPAAIALTALVCALHSSLQHEVIHGHPTPWPRLNALLVGPAIGLFIPYARFRDTHLAHHGDCTLTDPYEDPESNYLDPRAWARLPWLARALLNANNTLAGRITIGPVISQARFMAADWRAIRSGDRRVLTGWAWHLPALAPVLAWIAIAPMPLWALTLAAWAGLGLVKIRTFAEHRAHAHTAARTVVIEDRGPLAWLFLNNNLHAVHHMHPRVPWYRLPALYAANRARYLGRNGGYVLPSYGALFRRHFLRRKDPVPHPLYRG